MVELSRGRLAAENYARRRCARPVAPVVVRVTKHAWNVRARLIVGWDPAVAGLTSLRTWPARRWIVALVVALASALAIGIPTGIVQTSLYTRMTAVTWWDYPIWALSSVLAGLTAA